MISATIIAERVACACQPVSLLKGLEGAVVVSVSEDYAFEVVANRILSRIAAVAVSHHVLCASL